MSIFGLRHELTTDIQSIKVCISVVYTLSFLIQEANYAKYRH